MTRFDNVSEVIGPSRKLTKPEMARALRLAIADEYEAVQVYTMIAESTDDEGVRAVVMDIVKEEQVHASQFWELLAEIDPYEEEAWHKADAENKELKKRARGY
ncbi:MAG TPA: ferritin family protein [Methanomassiliicoccales archaeon]|nr:ferritin family protein [Methanomassiliicoccales archaeon]